MSIFEAVILGLIQGLTEFLPVSSSAHLALARVMFGLEESPVFLEGLLHLGTLAAVFVAFRKLVGRLIVALFTLIGDVFRGKFRWSTAPQDQKLMIFLMLSCMPLFIILPLKDKIENMSSYLWVVGLALIINGVVLFLSDFALNRDKTTEKMTAWDSLAVGFMQLFAIVPGISRSGSTITVGVCLGFDRKFAAEYSFMLSIPTILAGAAVSIWDAVSENAIRSADFPAYLIGTLTAAVVGFGAIKLLQYLLKTKKFFIFAIYSLIVGVFAVTKGIISL